MAIPKPRPSWFLGAILLAPLAPAAGAADGSRVKTGGAPSIQIDALSSDVSRPEDFQRFVEGSNARRDGAAAPRAFGRRDAGRRSGEARLRGGPKPGPRAEPASVPSAPAENVRGKLANLDFLPETRLPVRGMSGVLGLGLMLIAASLVLEMISPAPAAALESLPEAPLPQAPLPAARTIEFFPTLARVESSVPKTAPFIDTRMPAPTWRAISLREHELIERWNASPEKSQGLASLTEWIDAHGCVEGVDARLLRAKLYRDA
jgi:hypothetical protein